MRETRRGFLIRSKKANAGSNVVLDIHIFLTKLDNLEKVSPLSVGAYLHFAFVAKMGSLCAEELLVTSLL